MIENTRVKRQSAQPGPAAGPEPTTVGGYTPSAADTPPPPRKARAPPKLLANHLSPSNGGAPPLAQAPGGAQQAEEKGGPTGPEPTRFGDWERKGRCSDF